jgi:transposase
MEARYGRADRIWVMDRGMVSEENIEFLNRGNRRYIVGTPKSMLKQFERELLKEDWQTVHEGLEVKLCEGPEGKETFILCRSADRGEKEKAMLARFEKRIEEGLGKMAESCSKRKNNPMKIERRVGRLLERNSRAAGLFDIHIRERKDGGAKVVWSKVEGRRAWAELSEGCYLLRSNVTDWSSEDLWHAYMQLTEAESAFRIHKTDLKIRPIWHQTPDRVQAHILVCFLAYVLWKTFAQLCERAGLGHEPRQIFEELQQIRMVDVVLPTRKGVDIRKRCITRPTPHQAILLDRLGFQLPADKKMTPM